MVFEAFISGWLLDWCLHKRKLHELRKMKMEVQAYPRAHDFQAPNNFRKAYVRHVIDGDTVVADIECLETITDLKQHCRLARINAPEMKTDNGPLAKAHLEMLSQSGGCALGCVFELLGRDNFGRRIVAIWTDDGSLNLNDRMVADGFAKVLEEGKT